MLKIKNTSPIESDASGKRSSTDYWGRLALALYLIGGIGYIGLISHKDKEETAYSNLIESKYEVASRTAYLTDGIELGEMVKEGYPYGYHAAFTDSKLRAKTTISFGRCAVDGEIIAIDKPSGTGLPEVTYVLPVQPILPQETPSVTIEVANIEVIKDVEAYKDCFVN